MAKTNLGKIIPIPKGNYSSSVQYEMIDIVKYDGCSYISKRQVPAGTPVSDETYWMKLNEKFKYEDLTDAEKRDLAKDATKAAEEAATTLNELKEALQSLPDGQAVSEQVAENKVKLDALGSKVGDVDAEVKDAVIETTGKGGIKSNSGKFDGNTSSTTFKCVKSFIPIEGYEKVVFRGIILSSNSTSTVGYSFYAEADEDTAFGYKRYNLTEETNVGADLTLDIPEGAKYFRFTYLTADADNLFCKVTKGKDIATSLKDLSNEIKNAQERIKDVLQEIDEHEKGIDEKIKSATDGVRSLIIDKETISIDEALNADSQFFIDWMLFWTVYGKWAKQGVESPYRPGMGLFKIPAGLKVAITASTRDSSYYMLSDLEGIEVGGTPHRINEEFSYGVVSANTTAEVPVVDYDYYLAVRQSNSNGVSYFPSAMSINGEQKKEVNKIDDNTARIKKLEEGIIDNKSPYFKGELTTYKADTIGWYKCLEEDFAETFNRSTTYDYVIAAFDSLVEGVSDIRKISRGYASGTRADGSKYELFEYVLSPMRSNSPLGNTRTRPKFLMTGSVHGFEKNATYALYYMLKDILTNWDKNEGLRTLRFGCELHILPAFNPYGFDNNTYTNGNGVNINRNFPCPKWDEWTETGVQYHGEYPLDQPESQAIAQVIAENADALAFLDCHTNGQYWTTGWNEATSLCSGSDIGDAYFNRFINNVLSRHIEMQTAMWSKIYDLHPTGAIGQYQLSAVKESSKGTIDGYAISSGEHLMLGTTLEAFNGLKGSSSEPDADAPVKLFSQLSKKMNAENIGNMILQILTEFGL